MTQFLSFEEMWGSPPVAAPKKTPNDRPKASPTKVALRHDERPTPVKQESIVLEISPLHLVAGGLGLVIIALLVSLHAKLTRLAYMLASQGASPVV